MRTSLIGILVVAAMALIGASTAKASATEVTLSPSNFGINFASSGTATMPSNTVTVDFSSVTGSAMDNLGDSYVYTFSSPMSVTLTANPLASPTIFYSASNTPVDFSLTGGAGNLTGTFDLIDLSQATEFSQFDYVGTADLTVSSASGELSSFLSAGSGTSVLQINISPYLGPVNENSSESAQIFFSGITPAPEPSSMLLFGSGLLVFGIVLRKHLHA